MLVGRVRSGLEQKRQHEAKGNADGRRRGSYHCGCCTVVLTSCEQQGPGMETLSVAVTAAREEHRASGCELYM
jgi:hypothetical protein